jgi:hypothetical protein
MKISRSQLKEMIREAVREQLKGLDERTGVEDYLGYRGKDPSIKQWMHRGKQSTQIKKLTTPKDVVLWLAGLATTWSDYSNEYFIDLPAESLPLKKWLKKTDAGVIEKKFADIVEELKPSLVKWADEKEHLEGEKVVSNLKRYVAQYLDGWIGYDSFTRQMYRDSYDEEEL